MPLNSGTERHYKCRLTRNAAQQFGGITNAAQQNAAQQECCAAEKILLLLSKYNILMRKLILIIPALMILQITAMSQESISSLDSYLDRLNRDKDYFGSPHLKYKDIEGSPYLYDEFMEGLLYMKSGVVFSGEYRFDLYGSQIEFKRDENVFTIAIPDSIIKLETELFTVGYIEFVEKTEVKKAYMLLLEEGYYTICHQKKKIFHKAEPVKPYQDTATPARFENAGDDYYLKAGDSPAEKIGNAKDIIRICGSDGEKAKAFIETGKINVKKEEDLVRLVKYLNEGAKATRH
jgi:hypothetical protein